MERNTSENRFFSELLQQFRTNKRLNQKQLAKQIGVSREAVSLWERGYYKPETDTILYEIVRVLGLTEQEQSQLFEAYSVTALVTSFHNPPMKRNPYFTGRSLQLTSLHRLLMAGKQVALTQAISGLGGIGKTQLALEYAYRYQKSYHDIFWAFADTDKSLMESFVRLAAILHLPEYDEPDQKKVKAAVQRWLSKHTGWLLVLDNIEDLNLVNQFVPVDRQGAVLLTTRRQVTEPIAQALKLELMPENDCILFLLKRTKILSFDMLLDDASARDIPTARAITRALGNLPLALDQAGAYILETGCSLSDYLNLFNKYQAELLKRRGNFASDYPASVATTWSLSFEKVQLANPAAVELLRLCAFLGPDAIPEEIITAGISELGPPIRTLAEDPMELNSAIGELLNYSLLHRDSEIHTLSIHRLIQEVIKDEMTEEQQQLWAERAVRILAFNFPDSDRTTWPICKMLLPHVLACVSYIRDWNMAFPEAGELLNNVGHYLYDQAQYRDAEPLLQQAFTINTQVLGSNDPNTFGSLYNLALLYTAQGNYVQAKPLYQEALALSENVLGPTHHITVSILHSLASLHTQQGHYDQAESLYKLALERMQAPSLYHPDVADLFGDWADLYVQQGKYNEAEGMYKLVLQIYSQIPDTDLLHVAYCLHALADVLAPQGKYEQAEQSYQYALEIYEQILGPTHSKTLNCRNDLALLYSHHSDYDQAEALQKHVVMSCEQTLGPDHPDTAHALYNLATFYAQQEDYKQAESLYRRSWIILEEALGSDHPEVASCLDKLANLYAILSKPNQALPLYEHALAIHEKALGPYHSKTAYSLYILATSYAALENYDQAVPIYERALNAREQSLGPDHPDTIHCLNNLAFLYAQQRNYVQAESLYQRALQYYEKTLGLNHPNTADCFSNLAGLHVIQGNYDQANLLYQRTLAIYRQTLGSNHSNTKLTEDRIRLLQKERQNLPPQ